MGKFRTVTGKARVKNVHVDQANRMTTISLDKGEALTKLIQGLEAARRDNRLTDTVQLWVRDHEIVVSNAWQSQFYGSK
jgi:hypothetical protein